MKYAVSADVLNCYPIELFPRLAIGLLMDYFPAGIGESRSLPDLMRGFIL